MCTSSANFHSYLVENLSYQLEVSQTPTSYVKFEYAVTGLVTEKDRESLLIWVIDLCKDLNISTATGVLACHYLDKFLSSKPRIQRKIYELIGLTALGIASKFKEGVTISPERIRTLLENRFTVNEITTTENYMLQTLNWELSLVTACDLVESICEFTFGETVSNSILKIAFSFAALCYTDLQLAHSGNFSIALSSILLTLKQLGHSNVQGEWLRALENNFVIDREKLEIVQAMSQKKIAGYASC